MVHVGREQIRERHCRVVWRDGETVNFAKRAERDVARNEEIPQELQVRRGRRRHVDEKTVERSRFLRRRGRKYSMRLQPTAWPGCAPVTQQSLPTGRSLPYRTQWAGA